MCADCAGDIGMGPICVWSVGRAEMGGDCSGGVAWARFTVILAVAYVSEVSSDVDDPDSRCACPSYTLQLAPPVQERSSRNTDISH